MQYYYFHSYSIQISHIFWKFKGENYMPLSQFLCEGHLDENFCNFQVFDLHPEVSFGEGILT